VLCMVQFTYLCIVRCILCTSNEDCSLSWLYGKTFMHGAVQSLILLHQWQLGRLDLAANFPSMVQCFHAWCSAEPYFITSMAAREVGPPPQLSDESSNNYPL